jgi:hypothetical protein
MRSRGCKPILTIKSKKKRRCSRLARLSPWCKSYWPLNDKLPGDLGIDVILLSRNSADTGLRVFNSIEHYGLGISRAAFCGGEAPWRYIKAFGCQLFLSAEGSDVRVALDNGVAAATLVSSVSIQSEDPSYGLLLTVTRCCSPTSPNAYSRLRVLTIFCQRGCCAQASDDGRAI